MKKTGKGCLLLLIAALLLGGCASEQTLVRKVNEPIALKAVEELPADSLELLADEAQYPVSLRQVQLSPGGLYLLLWGVEDGQSAMYLLNLDKGDLTAVALPEALRDPAMTMAEWCARKTLLMGDDQGSTVLCTVTGWDD